MSTTEEQDLPPALAETYTPPPPRQYEDVDPYSADHRDYLLMQSRVNLMATSQMSDLKANLMLTLAAVMMQFALVKVSDHTLNGPVAHYWVIVIGSLTTILLSAWSTMPKTGLDFSEKPDDGNRVVPKNILFFNTYIRLSLPEYKRHMERILSSPPHTHEAIMEELHAHGRYLARRKYMPLSLAYASFLLTWIIGAALYLSA